MAVNGLNEREWQVGKHCCVFIILALILAPFSSIFNEIKLSSASLPESKGWW